MIILVFLCSNLFLVKFVYNVYDTCLIKFLVLENLQCFVCFKYLVITALCCNNAMNIVVSMAKVQDHCQHVVSSDVMKKILSQYKILCSKIVYKGVWRPNLRKWGIV